jgi:predicted ATPase
MPVLEALGRLSRQPDGERLVPLLRQYAPTWLVQLPAVLPEAELEVLQRQVAGVTRERMLRELAEALDVITTQHPLVLVLEDLHWSDVSTLDLLSLFARRREVARVLVIGTYRPVELIVTDHPLKTMKQELAAHGQCVEMPLRRLSPAAVQMYLAQRFVDRAEDKTLAALVYQRTDGHPLFMVQVADYMAQQEVQPTTAQAAAAALEQVIPPGLRELIEVQVGRLRTEEQQVLEVGSVAGTELVVASVVAGVQSTPDTIEAVCEGLARRGQFIEDRGLATWPDGTVSGQYRFRHALYQAVLYDRLGVGHRARLHRLIGLREEAGYGELAVEIAAELAVHFERGQDYRRAVRYLHQAGENALRRYANHEAITHLSKGMELLLTLPETPKRTQQELALQIALGTSLMATKGYAAPEVERAYLRARELCEQVGGTSQLFQVLRGLVIFYTVRANFQTARKLGEQFLSLAQQAQDPAFLELPHMLLGTVLLWLGELTPAQAHFAQGAAFHDPQQDSQRRTYAVLYGQDPEITLLCHAAWMLWLLGHPDQALQRSQEALHLAQALSHPFSLAFALVYAAGVRQFRREEQAAQQGAEAAIALSSEQGFRFLFARGMSVRGWVLTEQGQVEEGIAQMRQSLAIYQTLGTERGKPHFLADLADAYRKVGQSEEGLTLVARAQEALTISGERWWEAEVYRLTGELTLQSRTQSLVSNSKTSPKSKIQSPKSKIRSTRHPAPSTHAEAEAEACFLKAIEIARRQQAKSLELRAVMSLARLWQQQGKKEEARKLLAEIYGWFTEGFDTKDLQEAKALLTELSEFLVSGFSFQKRMTRF